MDETATTTGPKQATPDDTPSESTTEVLPAADDSPTTQLSAATEADSPTTVLPAASPSDDSPTEVIQQATPPSAAGSEPKPDDATPPKPDLLSTKLRRSKDDKMISGVCGGFAKTLGIDPLWLRLGLIVAVLLGFGVGLIVYLACWILMPLED